MLIAYKFCLYVFRVYCKHLLQVQDGAKFRMPDHLRFKYKCTKL